MFPCVVCMTEFGLLSSMTLPLVSIVPCVAVWMTDCWFAWMTECTCRRQQIHFFIYQNKNKQQLPCVCHKSQYYIIVHTIDIQPSPRQRLTDVTTIGLPVPCETRPSTEPPVPFSSTIPSITRWDRRYVLRNQTTEQCTHTRHGGTVTFLRHCRSTGRKKPQSIYMICVRGITTGRAGRGDGARRIEDEDPSTRVFGGKRRNVGRPSCHRERYRFSARSVSSSRICRVLKTQGHKYGRVKVFSSFLLIYSNAYYYLLGTKIQTQHTQQ